MDDTLTAVALIEKDNNGDVLTTCMTVPFFGCGGSIPNQTYPIITEETVKVAQSRSGLANPTIPVQFSFSKYRGEWLYIFTAPNSHQAGEATRRIVAFSIVLITTSFHPEKYAALAKLLSNTFNSTGETVKVLDKYLAAMGGFLPTEEYDPDSFPPTTALLATPLRDIITLLEEDFVHVWSALLAKKRIVVFCEKVGPLLKFTRALPLLVWHRQDWNILRPYVTVTDEELTDLKEASIYVAGFTDPAVKRMANLYDVLVNISERQVVVAEHAQEDIVIDSPFHKELATKLVQLADNAEVNDQTLIKELAKKTKSLLQKLESLKETGENGESYITIDAIQQHQLPPGMDRFLFNVAAAEGMTKS